MARRLHPVISACALMLVALAGCADPEPAAAVQEPAIAADTGVGAVAGIVVDQNVRPLAGANVTMTGPAASKAFNTTTDDAGAFAFSDVPHGTYLVQVRRTTYLEALTTVHVAGTTPIEAKLTLLPDPQYQAPFFEQQVFEGYYTCVGNFVSPCDMANTLTGQQLTDDDIEFTLYVTPGAEFVQSEIVWEPSGPGSENLWWSLTVGYTAALDSAEPECPSDFFTYTEGASPSVIAATAQDLGAGFAAYQEPCDFLFTLQAGPIFGSPCVGYCAGLSVDQGFKVYLTSFYGYAPPEGWRFVDENAVPPPPV